MKKFTLVVLAFLSLSFGGNVDEVQYLIKEGNQLHDTGHYDEAVARYKEAEALDPKNALVQYELCYTYYAKKEFAQALSYGKKALELNDSKRLGGQILGLLGSIYDELGVNDSAMVMFHRGYESNPKDFVLSFNAGVTCSRQNNVDSARVWFLRSAANTRVHASTYSMLGFISNQRGYWVDLFSYGMFTLLLTKNEQQSSSAYNWIYGLSKSLVQKGGKDSIIVTLPQNYPNTDLDQGFVLAMSTVVAMDSVDNRRLYDKDSTTAQQMNFLIGVSREAIKMIAGYNDDSYKCPLLSFYQGLVKENLVDAFVYTIYLSLDRPTYAQWRLKNSKEVDRLYDWMNGAYRKEFEKQRE